MTIRLHRPGPPLDRLVECFWHIDGQVLGHARERLLPTGRLSIVFRLHDEPIRVFADTADAEGARFSRAVMLGPYARYFVLDTSRPRASVGIFFRAGVPASVLGAPAAALANLHVALADIWGPSALDLHERVCAADTPEAAFQLLERALIARLGDRTPRHPAVAYALRRIAQAPTLARIAALREETGYAPKRFIELFRGEVGLSPKTFCRLQRFQRVIAGLAQGQGVDWAGIAADGGYCDQSHLNREFRAFTGVTPGQYRPLADGNPNHVPIDD